MGLSVVAVSRFWPARMLSYAPREDATRTGRRSIQSIHDWRFFRALRAWPAIIRDILAGLNTSARTCEAAFGRARASANFPPPGLTCQAAAPAKCEWFAFAPAWLGGMPRCTTTSRRTCKICATAKPAAAGLQAACLTRGEPVRLQSACQSPQANITNS